MSLPRRLPFSRAVAPLFAMFAVALTACGGGGGGGGEGGPAPSSEVSGTAAVGAPLVGSTVNATCSGGGSAPVSVVTSATGGYTLNIEDAAFPCVVTVTGGTASGSANTATLHSLAVAAGTVNVTPLTDLALALAVKTASGQTLETWSTAPANWNTVESSISDAFDTLRQTLDTAGYTLPPDWTAGTTAPLTTAFTADPASDPYDALLETLDEAIEASSTYADYAAFLESFANGGPAPEAADEEEEPGTLPAPEGDGAALGDADGATGTLDGTTYTYTGNVQWSSLTGGFLAYEATDSGFNPSTQWHLGGIPASVGTHACKSNSQGTLPRIQRVVNSVNYDTAPTGGACLIEVQSVSSGAITGRFSATLVDSDGAVIGTVTDGYFRKAVPTGDTLPPGEVGASFVVDGTTYRYTQATRDNYDGFPGGVFRPLETASPGYSVGFQIHTLPLTAGTAICDTPADGSNNYRKTNMQFFWYGKWYYAGRRANPEPGPTGSSCTVVVSQINDSLLEGSFNGTFVADDGASITVTDGLFRQQSGT